MEHPGVDELLDVLHEMGCCGCERCAPARMQLGETRTGRIWLSVVIAGERHEEDAKTLDQAARRLVLAIRPAPVAA